MIVMNTSNYSFMKTFLCSSINDYEMKNEKRGKERQKKNAKKKERIFL